MIRWGRLQRALWLAALLCLDFRAVVAQELGAGLPPEVRGQMHRDIRIGTIHALPRDANVIWGLRENPSNTDILEVRGQDVDLSSAQGDVIANWVANGGSLWIRTGTAKKIMRPGVLQLATQLGARIDERTFSRHWCNPLDAASSSDPVLRDVRQVGMGGWCNRVFLPSGGVSLLLYQGSVVAGYFRHGNGLVVIWPADIPASKLDGERFLVNLREFSAGYPVP